MKTIILFLTTEPTYGGEHQYAMLASECLVHHANKRFRLYAVCANSFWRNWCKKNKIEYMSYKLPQYSEQEMYYNMTYPLPTKIYNTYFTEIGKWLKEKKADVIFCLQQGIFMPNYFIRQIRPVHDIMHRYESQFPEIRCNYEERETVFKSVAKYTDLIFVDSNLGKKQFEECYIKGTRNKLKMVVLPFVVPEHILNTKEQYIETPSKYVFYPAQFWEHKNHMNLLKAIKILKNGLQDIHLVLVGSEKNMLKKINQYIKENELEENVTIQGFVSDEQITYLYKHAVGLVMPTYFGPTNIPPLEAMALGCPVAVSDKYAMPEQVGRAGLRFNPDSPEEIAECIKKMWSDEELRTNMIEDGYGQIKKWTKKEFEKKLVKVMCAI